MSLSPDAARSPQRGAAEPPGDGLSLPGFLAGGGEMGELIRATDWSQTPIGPIEAWSPSLRMMASVLLANRFPLLLWWGADYVSIYNDPYRPILGTKHPWALGKPVRECWSEIWDVLKPLIDTPFNGGAATWMEDFFLEINRHGFIEETHFTVAYSPVPDDTVPGGIGGVLATVHEITDKIVGERRILALRDLGAHSGEARSVEEACMLALAALAPHDRDVPFALVYLIDDTRQRARLVCAQGTEAGAAAAPMTVALDVAAGAIEGWPLAEALQGEGIVVVENLGARFGEVPPGPWTEPPHTAVVVPIKSNVAHEFAGFLVAGASPRLRLDERYRGFFDLAAAQITTAIATARAYEEARRRAEALAEIDRAKTMFFSNVSHEFRTPLALMLGPLEDVLADPALPEADRERLDLAHRNALRLLRLVNALLDFSRLEAGRMEASYEPVDLAALTADLASNFRSACERAGLRLVVDCAPLPERVHVDRDMWEKVVLNLLSNAVKFTFSGEIVVRLVEEKNFAILTVSDTGVGIPAGELPRLFERFHRIEGQRSRTHEGSGIGLALVQELVKLHGGAIEVASEPDRGTSFRVAVPFGTAHLPAERVDAGRGLASTTVRAAAYVEEALRWLPDGAETAARRPIAGANTVAPEALAIDTRILVADDNADMREYLRALLGPHCEVEAVADGEAAVAAIRARPPDVVLADVMMPRLDGFGLLGAIRGDAALRDLPVILLSARAGEESRVEGLKAGADDYLTKPFSARELVARVGAILELTRVRREARAALGASEARYRSLFEAIDEGFCIIEKIEAPPGAPLDFRYLAANPAFAVQTGVGDVVGNTIRGAFPDEPSYWFDTYAKVLETGEAVRFEHDLVGQGRTLELYAFPLAGASGRLGVIFQDVTQRRRADEHRDLLINELNHRVKNTLATVQSIATQTLRSAATPADARRALETRLIALSRAHDILTRENWVSADLHTVVSEALAAYAAERPQPRFVIEGPRLRLQPRAALALSMALHELATNAVKYGALKQPDGEIAVVWQAGDSHFGLSWRERGGPPVVPPRQRGFGSRLIERGLSRDFGGRAEIRFEESGVVCTIDAPLAEIRAG
ncbi:MAG TPA: ATP-binding protein [Hyphomicrobiales bacterium]|nr:ATP-binding protein [Hyphomicrobiales bacterium]